MTVVGDEGAAIVVVSGLVDNAVHVPAPLAVIVAVEYWQVVRSGPASGLAIAMTSAVSVHPFTVQMKPYVPAREKPLVPVAGVDGEAMLATAGLADNKVHVPAPIAVSVAVEY